jgi:diguanylate cyclase (GGDEF)-like protein
VKSPGSGPEFRAATQAALAGLKECDDAASLLLAELDATRGELASANRRIAQLSRQRKRSRITIGRLRSMATTDALTTLVNRRRFDEVLREHFANSVLRDSPLSVIMVDVDWFKSYNDTFGHLAGDFVLCVVAQHLKQSSRCNDVVARYAGDEFAVLLNDTDAVVAVNCAERYRQAMISFQWPLRPVTASIEDPAGLLEEADRALYHSKRGGRTRVIHLGILDTTETAVHTPQQTSAGSTGTPNSDDCTSPGLVGPFKHPHHSKGDRARVEDDRPATPERGAATRA